MLVELVDEQHIDGRVVIETLALNRLQVDEKILSLNIYNDQYPALMRLPWDAEIVKTKFFLFFLPPNTYYWTVPLILDHSYLVGKLTSRNLLIQKCQDFRDSKAFVSAIFVFVKFPTRYEWSNIRRPVQ